MKVKRTKKLVLEYKDNSLVASLNRRIKKDRRFREAIKTAFSSNLEDYKILTWLTNGN